jgi:hypothetical protein
VTKGIFAVSATVNVPLLVVTQGSVNAALPIFPELQTGWLTWNRGFIRTTSKVAFDQLKRATGDFTMRKLAWLLTALILAGFAWPSNPAVALVSEDKANVITEEVGAAELADAFANDPKAAAKKYVADPEDVKKGKVTGVPFLKPIHGQVTRVHGKEVYLETSTKITVVLRAKKTPKDIAARRKFATGEGFVVSFGSNRIVVQCEEVVIKPFMGK